MKRGQMESDFIWWPLSVVVLVLVDQIETDDSDSGGRAYENSVVSRRK